MHLDTSTQSTTERSAGSMLDNLRRMPFFEDAYFHMRAHHLSLADTYLRSLEDAYRQAPAMPEDEVILGALSEMWMMAAYDLLHAWREQARVVLTHPGLSDQVSTASVSVEISEQIAGSANLRKVISRLRRDVRYGRKLRRYAVSVERIYKHLREVRELLARNEVLRVHQPNAGSAHVRIDPVNGSLVYALRTRHGTVRPLSRVEIADALTSIHP
jgi:hypothetical protein